jgi:hypothetical protein
VQCLKTSPPIEVTFVPIVIDVNDPQFMNALFSIVITLLGMENEENEQPSKAEIPNLVTLLPTNVTDDNDPHIINAPSGISVTPLGIVIDVNGQDWNT